MVIDWSRDDVRVMLGMLGDAEVARRLGVTRQRVAQVRTRLRIARRPSWQPPAELVARLGQAPDTELAREFGISHSKVREARQDRGVASYQSTHPVPCGTRTRYNAGCRCDLCRRVNADAMNEWRTKNPGRFAEIRERTRARVLASAPHRKGSISNYVLGCRCDRCRKAANKYNRAKYAARKNARAADPPVVPVQSGSTASPTST